MASTLPGSVDCLVRALVAPPAVRLARAELAQVFEAVLLEGDPALVYAASDAARRLVSDVPINKIASLLAYGDTTAFHRAFKSWPGNTPSEIWSQGD